MRSGRFPQPDWMDDPSCHRMQPGSQHRLTFVAFVWLAVCVCGIGVLTNYSSRPGKQRPVPDLIDDGHPAVESPAYRLTMFVHPRCPCSAASVNELARLMAACPRELSARVCFLAPSDESATWWETSLWHSAERIPRVEVVADTDAATARRFGAMTSGHVVLYDSAGRLQFSGGITCGRGHEGDNRGRNAICDIVRNRTPRAQATPVFGCPLVAGNAASSLDGSLVR